MIITLKGADFSASNIGTLSTWRISRSLGAGATYEGVTSVNKGASFTATITLTEGYEVGTTGVTVTMGGTVLNNAHSISDNVVTITIAEVTGNVLIKVPTVNTATGDEENPEVPDELEQTTITVETYTLTIRNAPTDMIYENGLSVTGITQNKFAGFAETAGRAAAENQVVKASAGQTITLNQVIDGVNLTYSLFCFTETGEIASTDKNFTAKAWLSDAQVLPANTAYTTLAFKRGDGSSNFTSDEIALLKNAITIS